MILYPIGKTKACLTAASILERQGFSLIDHPSPDITHLLLDIPSFQPDGLLRGGGTAEAVLERLPSAIHVIGGKLEHSAFAEYPHTDLLKDPYYLADNAAITADCAIRLSGTYLEHTFSDSSALVIGWGRIGKCLAAALKSLGCTVTVAARKPGDRAMLFALGYHAIKPEDIPMHLPGFTILYNTVPAPVLSVPVPDICLAFELASVPGICGKNIIPASGLPGKMAPQSSGKLIADTILRFYQEGML